MGLADDLAEASAPAIPLKVLLYDIETAPMLAHIWHPTDDYVPHDRLIHDTFMLSWAAKWRGADKVLGASLTSAEALGQDDTRIVTSLASLVRQADIVVAHNGDRFDIPILNARVIKLGLPPLGPVKSIDTLKLAKRNLKVAYNKLDYLGEFFGLGRKLSTTWSLWQSAYHGNAKAIREMATYNKQDVVLLEQVFERLLPYVKGIPRLMEATDVAQGRCPSCGSAELVQDGRHLTNASTFVTLRCEACGRYCRSRKANNVKFGLVPL